MSGFNNHLNFEETKQWSKVSSARIEFNYRRMSPHNINATKAKSSSAFNVLYVETKIYPDGEYLLTNEMTDSEVIFEQGNATYASSYPVMEEGEEVEIMIDQPDFNSPQYIVHRYGYQYFLKDVADKS